MTDMIPLHIDQILRRYGLRPKKGLGQNFLSDSRALKKIVAAGQVTQDDHVLEIGSGLGSLTRYLALEAKRVVAVEIDVKLLPPLQEVVAPYDNVEIIRADILELDLTQIMDQSGYLVIANIPYYITSAIIRHLLSSAYQPARIVLTVQKEVAQRICATPGSMSLLALSVQVYGNPTIAATIPAAAFYPPPKVDSAVINIELYDSPQVPVEDIDLFFALIRAGFSQKRKTLRNTLSAGMQWPKTQAEAVLAVADIEMQRRAQTLSMEEWGRLVDVVKNKKFSE